MSSFRHGFFCLSLLILFVPCLASAASKAGEENVVLNVLQGNTLLKICDKFLENRKNCRELAKINHLGNPDRIYPGQRITIPIRFLKGTPMEGRVTFLKGDVRVRAKQVEEWVVLHLDDPVHEGSSTKTGPESTLEITFKDGSSIFQNADTVLEVSTSREGPLHLLRELFLPGGRTITKVKGATGREQRFIIRTPSALAAVRGTEFRVSSDTAATTRSEVLAGTVDVAAMEKHIEVEENEGTAVQKGLPPLAPRKLLPPPQVILRPPFNKFPLESRFTGVAGATTYRALLTRDREGKNIVKEEVIKTDEPFLISGVEDGTYHIWGMSIDDAGITGAPSEPAPLLVRINPLPPFLRSPVKGAEFRSKTVDLSWLKVRDATGYHLQIGEDREFTRIVAEVPNQKNVEYAMKPLEFGQYFFRVSSIAADGYEGAWSDTRSFTVMPLPPAPPLEKPAMNDEEIRISWRDLGAGYTYHCQIARDNEFTEMMIDTKLTRPEMTIKKPEKNGTYFVRTSAIDGKGYEGHFSQSQSFDIARRFPYGVLGLLVPLGVILLLAL